MREKPILFSAPMVRAILSGSKSQTRRICKPQPVSVGSLGKRRVYRDEEFKRAWETIKGTGECAQDRDCPYEPGDRLWVREAFMPCPLENPTTDPSMWSIAYASDAEQVERLAPAGYNPMLYNYERWSPSIHMPRWASRITLEITSVRVERLQDISEADAIAEGVTAVSSGGVTLFATTGVNCFQTAKDAYAALWESINGPGSWDANPWVWVVEFRRVLA